MSKLWSRTKLLTVALLAVLAMVIVACGGTPAADPAPPGPADSGTETPAPSDNDGEELTPLTVRFVADFPPPPHPAALAMEQFAKRLPEVIPGSEARVYHAGALYSIPEAVEAMADGALEMTWGQFGKSGPVEPLAMAIVGPGLLTTIGAIDASLDSDTVKAIVERFDQRHGVTILGTGHLSHGMGAAAASRIVTVDDFAGMTIRSMGPAENAALDAWGAIPITMAFGEVPSAMESGVIDGMLTSLGGWGSVTDIAPYYTSGGVGGVTGDMYWIGASSEWLASLNEPTRNALVSFMVDEIIPLSKQTNWCIDQASYDQYGTDDPSQPGVYSLTPEEAAPLHAAIGTALLDWKYQEIDAEDHEWIDKFAEEAVALNEQNPPGSHWVEDTDCTDPELAAILP